MIISSPKSIAKIKKVLLLVAGWIIAGVYINTLKHVSVVVGHGTMDHSYMEMLAQSTIEVLFAGLILGSFEVFYFTDRFKNKPFVYAVIMKSFFYFFAMIILIFLIIFFEFVNEYGFSIENTKRFSEAYVSNIDMVILTNFVPWGPVFLISIIFLQVSDKYGQGMFLKFISGKYHTPKSETRIFMFLDIKSSTSIAEALGSIKYFELINEVFYDVTDSIVEAKGEIYQYVGDEIVISWNLKNGIINSNCLNCFFDISDVLKNNAAKYESKYDLVPSFKAGVHYGEVTVGEIGVVKREIVFSGDVLNTTSRIQELCNKYNKKLIASKDLLDLMNLDNDIVADEIGEMNLRGRTAPVILYAVKRLVAGC